MVYNQTTYGCRSGYDHEVTQNDETSKSFEMKDYELCLEGSAVFQCSKSSMFAPSAKKLVAGGEGTEEHMKEVSERTNKLDTSCVAMDFVWGCTIDAIHSKLTMETLPDGFMCSRLSDKILLYRLAISGSFITIECGIILTKNLEVTCSSYNEVITLNIYEDLLHKGKQITSISQLMGLITRLSYWRQARNELNTILINGSFTQNCSSIPETCEIQAGSEKSNVSAEDTITHSPQSESALLGTASGSESFSVVGELTESTESSTSSFMIGSCDSLTGSHSINAINTSDAVPVISNTITSSHLQDSRQDDSLKLCSAAEVPRNNELRSPKSSSLPLNDQVNDSISHLENLNSDFPLELISAVKVPQSSELLCRAKSRKSFSVSSQVSTTDEIERQPEDLIMDLRVRRETECTIPGNRLFQQRLSDISYMQGSGSCDVTSETLNSTDSRSALSLSEKGFMPVASALESRLSLHSPGHDSKLEDTIQKSKRRSFESGPLIENAAKEFSLSLISSRSGSLVWNTAKESRSVADCSSEESEFESSKSSASYSTSPYRKKARMVRSTRKKDSRGETKELSRLRRCSVVVTRLNLTSHLKADVSGALKAEWADAADDLKHNISDAPMVHSSSSPTGDKLLAPDQIKKEVMEGFASNNVDQPFGLTSEIIGQIVKQEDVPMRPSMLLNLSSQPHVLQSGNFQSLDSKPTSLQQLAYQLLLSSVSVQTTGQPFDTEQPLPLVVRNSASASHGVAVQPPVSDSIGASVVQNEPLVSSPIPFKNSASVQFPSNDNMSIKCKRSKNTTAVSAKRGRPSNLTKSRDQYTTVHRPRLMPKPTVPIIVNPPGMAIQAQLSTVSEISVPLVVNPLGMVDQSRSCSASHSPFVVPQELNSPQSLLSNQIPVSNNIVGNISQPIPLEQLLHTLGQSGMNLQLKPLNQTDLGKSGSTCASLNLQLQPLNQADLGGSDKSHSPLASIQLKPHQQPRSKDLIKIDKTPTAKVQKQEPVVVADSSSNERTRRQRTIFTKKQEQGLANFYRKQKFINQEEKYWLCEELGLAPKTVHLYFQNRRAEESRLRAAEEKYRKMTQSHNEDLKFGSSPEGDVGMLE